jgi:hypothetical protein
MSGKKSRRLGHGYERQIRLEMIELGYEDCETSRYESKKLDDAKVDLTHTKPFNVQCKAYQNQPNFRSVLSEMPDDSNYNTVFMKKNVGVGKKRPEDIVVMWKKDFYELITMLKSEGII